MSQPQEDILPGAQSTLDNLSTAFELMRYAPSISLSSALGIVDKSDKPHIHNRFYRLGLLKGLTSPTGYFTPVAQAFVLLAEQALDNTDQIKLYHPHLLAKDATPANIPAQHVFNALLWGVTFNNFDDFASPTTRHRLHKGMVRLHECYANEFAAAPPVETRLEAINNKVLDRKRLTPQDISRDMSALSKEERLFVETAFEPLRQRAQGYLTAHRAPA